MDIDITDNIYIQEEDGEDYLVICPQSTDCDSVNIKKILEIIANENPALYMAFVKTSMMISYT